MDNDTLSTAVGIINAIIITLGTAAFVVLLWIGVAAVFSIGG